MSRYRPLSKSRRVLSRTFSGSNGSPAFCVNLTREGVGLIKAHAFELDPVDPQPFHSQTEVFRPGPVEIAGRSTGLRARCWVCAAAGTVAVRLDCPKTAGAGDGAEDAGVEVVDPGGVCAAQMQDQEKKGENPASRCVQGAYRRHCPRPPRRSTSSPLTQKDTHPLLHFALPARPVYLQAIQNSSWFVLRLDEYRESICLIWMPISGHRSPWFAVPQRIPYTTKEQRPWGALLPTPCLNPHSSSFLTIPAR